VLGNVGILSMTKDDIGWAMLLAVWLEKHSPADRELLKTLCDQYLATVIEYLGEVTKPPVFGKTETSSGYMKRMIYQPEEAMIVTFTTILDQLLHLIGLLTDYGKPVMLVGEDGCGKSAIVSERVRTVCSGEVAEVLGLTMQANR
ncbi:hypothetical protein LSH36_380g01070, partial [Paralvinella palmiformis]